MELGKENVLTVLKTLCEDEFLASVTEENGEISLKFSNGQTFAVSVEER